MEVMERPLQEFDEAKWEEQMKAAGLDTESRPAEVLTLSEALALPESLEDLWPGHCYLPPRLKQTEYLQELGNKTSSLWNEGKVLESMQVAAEFVCTLARKIEGDQLLQVSPEEVLNEFDAAELANICDHILSSEGFTVENAAGKSPSGRRIGAMSFHSSAAIIPTNSKMLESSPTNSIEL